jgi:hypothetical protein
MDAQIERINYTLKDIMLKMYIDHRRGTWGKYLVEFAYNGNRHSSIKTSTFHALYMQEYLTPLSISTPISKIVNEMIINMQYTLKLVKENIESAQEQAKFYVDKNLSLREFEVNDKVYLKVKPLRSALRLKKYSKLPL